MRSPILVPLACLFVLGSAACGSVSEPATDGGGGGGDGSGGDVDGAPEECVESCEGSMLTTCDADGNADRASCPLGCHDEELRCNDIDPSNGLASHLDDAESAPDVSFTGSATIDTDAGTVSDGAGAVAVPSKILTDGPVDVFVVKFKSLVATDIDVVGSRALAIVSDGDVVLHGVLSVSAEMDVNGPGAVPDETGCQGKIGAGSGGEWSGGGGGGFGGAGGDGGDTLGHSGGAGGLPTGNETLVPLRGGCPGGHSGGGGPSADPEAADPGGGGGAVQIVSRTSIELRDGAFVAANGGPGKGITSGDLIACQVGTRCGPGEGAGSGGGLLLEAPVVNVLSGAGLVANGGGGSCSLTGTGTPGQLSDEPAPGQSCGGGGGGGNGGAGDTPALSGADKVVDNGHGGGGGGSVGRIRVNLADGETFSPEGVVSPEASTGTVAVR